MNRPKSLFRFLCFAVVPLWWAAALGTCHGQELVVADGGQSEYRIVVASQPTHEESSAASELQKYLKLATGAELPVVKDDALPEGKCLVVGRRDTELVNGILAAPEAPKLKDHDEAFLVATVGDDIVLTGRAPHAVLYAVYDFLEDPVGCAWLFPEDLGEEVPRIETLKVGKLRRSEAPSFPFRWIGTGEWALRNKMNMRVRVGRKATGLEELLGGHSFRKLLDPAEYFDAHPEYFAMVAGRRSRSKNHYGDQYCTSNPDVVRVVAENMRKLLDANPRARIISLSPNDGLGFCECDRCMALDDPGPYTLKDLQTSRNSVPFEHARGLISRRMLLFYNAVARELAETHPDVLIKSFAYSCYASPPKDPALRAEPNMMIQLCHSVCHNHRLSDPSCPYNVGYASYLDGWGHICGNLAIYEYYWKTAWLDLPWPILHSMRHDIPQYH